MKTPGPRLRAYLQLHTAVLLFGFTGILGDVIQLDKGVMVWWRMVLSVLGLAILPGSLRMIRSIPRPVMARLAGIGALVAFHWVFLFSAIEATNVSVTLALMGSASFFTSLIEPLLLKKAFKWYEMMLGLLVIPGVWIIYQSTGFAAWGIIMALLSALLSATFNVLNKPLVERYAPVGITMVELGSGALVLSFIAPFWFMQVPDSTFLPVGIDWLYLGLLSIVCTCFAFVITLNALKVLNPFVISLSLNLEPIYSILLAVALLAENKELNSDFYLGAGIVLISVFSHPFLDRLLNKRKATQGNVEM